jgi:hypothetical protein
VLRYHSHAATNSDCDKVVNMPWTNSDDQAEPPVRKLLTERKLSALAQGANGIAEGDPPITAENFPAYVLECVWAVIEEKLEPDNFPVAVNAPGLPGSHSALLSHVFWLVWADIEGPKADAFTEDLAGSDLALGNPQAGRVVAALQEARRKELVQDIDLFEVLDLRLLVQSGLSAPSKHPTSFAKKMTLTYNNRSMKISLYNTFREDLEGFAKLVTLLNNPFLTHSDHLPQLCTEIDQLTGYYRLSPAKVCTCVLVAMERSPEVAAVRPTACPLPLHGAASAMRPSSSASRAACVRACRRLAQWCHFSCLLARCSLCRHLTQRCCCSCSSTCRTSCRHGAWRL